MASFAACNEAMVVRHGIIQRDNPMGAEDTVGFLKRWILRGIERGEAKVVDHADALKTGPCKRHESISRLRLMEGRRM